MDLKFESLPGARELASSDQSLRVDPFLLGLPGRRHPATAAFARSSRDPAWLRPAHSSETGADSNCPPPASRYRARSRFLQRIRSAAAGNTPPEPATAVQPSCDRTRSTVLR